MAARRRASGDEHRLSATEFLPEPLLPTGSAHAEPVRVLVVDDDPQVREVLQALLAGEGCETTARGDAQSALDALAGFRPDLVLSDLKMPGRDGMWLLEHVLRAQADMPVVMLTGFGDTETAVECLRRGAADYLLKPPRVVDLVRALERALARRRSMRERARYQAELEQRVREKTAELSRALADLEGSYSSTLAALVAALDAREQETGDHSQRVLRFTLAIASELGMGGREAEETGRGALLHDIGKIGVSDAILLKRGPLTADEWVHMRRHPDTGHAIIANIPFLGPAAQIVLSHHERWDGGGYPRGLSRDGIPAGARIFSVADALDAIASDRPYRAHRAFADARAEIVRCSGTQFDPRVVEAFLRLDDAALEKIRRG